MERTLVLLKPDCVQRRLMGGIIERFERKGFRIAAMKMMRMTPELAKRFYHVHVEKEFYPHLEAFITGGPLVAMVLEGSEAISVVRKMIGATDGRKAEPGTVRGDLTLDKQQNLVHASDSPESAAHEMPICFSNDEIQSA